MPKKISPINDLAFFFLRMIFLTVSFYGTTGFIAGCGSSTTIIYQNAAGEDGGDEGGDEVTANAPNSTGTPVTHFQNQHMDLLFSGGNAIPITYSHTESGSVEISSDLSY